MLLDKPVRKSAGLLLEAAGRSLLQRNNKLVHSSSVLNNCGGAASGTSGTFGGAATGGGGGGGLSTGATGLGLGLASSSGLFDLVSSTTVGGGNARGKALTIFIALSVYWYSILSLFANLPSTVGGAKLSFGLYTGNLSVEHGNNFKSPGGGTGSDSDGTDSLGSAAMSSGGRRREDVRPAAAGDGGGGGGGGPGPGAMGKPVKKVFTNWGGEFFKKNLDYRANTNKILEKMNLGSGSGAGSSGVGGSVTVSVGGSSSSSSSSSSMGGGALSSPGLLSAASTSAPTSSQSSSSSLPNFIPGDRFKALLGSATASSSPPSSRLQQKKPSFNSF